MTPAGPVTVMVRTVAALAGMVICAAAALALTLAAPALAADSKVKTNVSSGSAARSDKISSEIWNGVSVCVKVTLPPPASA